MDLKEEQLLGDDPGNHWYYKVKGNALIRLLGERCRGTVLDVGAGSGYFSRLLLQRTPIERSVCVDPGYAEERREQVSGKSLSFRRRGDEHADVILMLDVLEHVDDDVGLIEEYVSQVKSGSWLAISVPAFQFMWSAHDEFLEHRRRYTITEVEDVVRRSGMEIVKSCYFFGIIFPLAWASRKLTRSTGSGSKSQLRTHSPIVNRLLTGLCTVELGFFERNRLFGLSVFCLARKR